MGRIREFFKKETVLCVAAVCAVGTMFLVPPDGAYIGYIDLRVLCLLMSLMAVVAGFQSCGAFRWLAFQLLRRSSGGRVLSVILVMLPFFSSMLVTNDVALLTFVPFTLLLLEQIGCTSAVIPVLVLQTVAANLGSMATPVGNPQNLYLYARYNIGIGDFFAVTLPLTAVSLLVLAAAAVPLLPAQLPLQTLERASVRDTKALAIYFALFALCLLTVFRVVPYPVTTAITVAVFFWLDRGVLKEIDYMLLLTFVCFFTVSENLGRIEAVRTVLQQLLQWNTLLTAVGTSQVISNVPAAVVLSGFTDRWQQLLAGVNIGGLGTPIASLASLITLKFYMGRPGARIARFLACFTLVNLIGLAVLLLFYSVL